MQILLKVCYIHNLNMHRNAQFFKYCLQIAKLMVNIIVITVRLRSP